MNISPYLYFNGNCIEAITLYEKAFNAEVIAQMVPTEGGGNFVAHAQFEIDGNAIFLCDSEQLVKVGDNTMIAIQFNAEDENELATAKMAFGTLEEGGKIIMAFEENSWSKCFGILIDQFGVKWNMCGGIKE